MRLTFKIFSLVIFLIFIILLYLSFIGLETRRFNNLISEKLNGFNPKITSNINVVKIHFNFKTFSFDVKSNEPEIFIDNKKIIFKEIKTNIPLTSLSDSDFLISNLEFSTKKNNIKELLQILREVKYSPEFFLLNKFIKKGEIIINANIKINKEGKIKNDYFINGEVINGEIKLLNKNLVKYINFNFDIRENIYYIYNSKLSYRDNTFNSQKIEIVKKDNVKIQGEFENDLNYSNMDFLNIFIDPGYIENINDLKLFSKNNFSFFLDKKLKVKDLKIVSQIKLTKLHYKLNDINNIKMIDGRKNLIKLSDHSLKLSYKKDNILIDGEGEFSFNKNKDKANYLFKKSKKGLLFNTNISIIKNPISLELLEYYKPSDERLDIAISGTLKKNGSLIIEKANLLHKKNELSILNLELDKEKNLNKLDSVLLNLSDENNYRNNLDIKRKKNRYFLKSKHFNGVKFIDKILKGEKNQKNNLFNKKDIELILKINELKVDKESFLNDFNGSLFFKRGKIFSASIQSTFNDKKDFNFLVNTEANGQVITSLYAGNAKPLVNKYKFIKGFDDGSLDFYSIKNGGVTKSTLKIYNFRLKELPSLTKLLTLASLQGIADTLKGEGIRFNEFEMNFNKTGSLMTIDEVYAIGPAISVLMSGYVESEKIISLKGTLVPATTLNKVIGSIPFLGNILVGTKTGEGVFGVSFKIKGPPKKLKTTVNPIKTLTPRFITRTLEKIKNSKQ